MSEIPKNLHRKFWVNEKGEVFQNLLPGGESLLAASACLLPSARETRNSILRIRREFKLSRAQLAVCLGVGKHTLRRWESGERSPSHAGRRLIQLVQMLFFAEDIAASDFGAVMIGRIDLKGLENAKRALLPDSVRRLEEGLRERRTQTKLHNEQPCVD